MLNANTLVHSNSTDTFQKKKDINFTSREKVLDRVVISTDQYLSYAYLYI